MYYVYVLQSEAGEAYIGKTGDLKRRMREHNTGCNTSTRHATWRLVYYEAYANKADADRRERRLKDDGRARYQLMRRIRASIS